MNYENLEVLSCPWRSRFYISCFLPVDWMWNPKWAWTVQCGILGNLVAPVKYTQASSPLKRHRGSTGSHLKGVLILRPVLLSCQQSPAVVGGILSGMHRGYH